MPLRVSDLKYKIERRQAASKPIAFNASPRSAGHASSSRPTNLECPCFSSLLFLSSTPRSYNGTMLIGIARRLCAVKIVDKPAQSGENSAPARSLAGAEYTGPHTQWLAERQLDRDNRLT